MAKRSTKGSTCRENSMTRVIRTPPSTNPIPTASPIVALAQRVAAVVNPLTRWFEMIIVPTPRKPTPLMTCAAIRSILARPEKWIWIYCSVNITNVAPRQTTVIVFVPAPRCFIPRSRPIIPPRIIDTMILMIRFCVVQSEKSPNIICISSMLSFNPHPSAGGS